MPRSQPGPATQLFRAGESGHVTDLGDQDRGEGRADPADLLDHPVAAVPGEPVGDHRPGQFDLPVIGVDQLEQRVDALAVDQIQRRNAQPCLPGGPEHVRHLRQQALLGQHPMHLGFQPGTQRDELGPVAHQLAELPLVRGRDVGLGQPTHPQQVRQIGGVTDVVLHPPIREPLHPQRVRQMHGGAGALQHIDRPVPAVSRFEHDFGVGAGLGQFQPQRDRVVVDADPAQLLALRRHPHDHTAAAVQIDTDVLPTVVVSVHRGLPQRVVVSTPEHPLGTTKSGGPALSSH
jgi:hypothetical protein